VALATLAGAAVAVVLALRAKLSGGRAVFTEGQVRGIFAQQEAEHAAELAQLEQAYRALEEDAHRKDALNKLSGTLKSVLTHDGIGRTVKGYLHPDHAKTEKERRAREELFKRWGILVDWAKGK
jgi:hypothetical protein